ncbi:hypothetical protein BC567DRAFT_209548 [Phyllosticta citribraziliensis]
MDYDQKKLCLVEGLEDFASGNFQSKDYTDLTIRCQDKEFYVHKLVVCLFSAFFAKACKPDSPFKVSLEINAESTGSAYIAASQEARTGIIELHEDDPADVKLLLDSFYSSWYASRLCDARLYAIAEKYQAPCAKLHAADIFRRELDNKHGYMTVSASGFVKLAKRVFESTPDSDRVFRNLVFRYANRHLAALMSWSHFQTEMEKVDGFFSGLARFQTFYVLKTRMCPTCGKPQKNRWEDNKIYRGGDMH